MADQEQSVEQIFGAALELPSEQRAAFLDQACQGAPEVRAVVDHLLREEEQLGSFLNTPILQGSRGSSPFSAKTASGTQHPVYTNSGSSSSRFQPGETIAERFLIARFIARGGMGEVYEAHDQYLQGELVAVKIIRPEIAADSANLHRFEQEVILARKLTHPNLCPIYEIFRCEEPSPPFLFLTMKLLRGETLDVLLRTHRPLPAGDAAEICTQLVRGVAAMHGADVVHRDLKPNNVMLERTAAGLHVSIMDFGLARIHEAETTVLRPGMVAGTPGYLAPELLRGQLPSKASDLFALGVVLHQVLTGERPHVSADGFSMRPVSSLRVAAVPPQFLHAVETFLADDPERRCRAFDELHALTSVHRLPQQRAPLLSRRQLLYGAGALGCAAAVGSVWRREQIYDWTHPLPRKRFVALLTWPPASDAHIRPVLSGVIDAIAIELSRVEAFDHNFFVAAQERITEVSTPEQLNDVRESLGANLVLAASGIYSAEAIRVLLRVIDPVTLQTLRESSVHVPQDQEFSIPERSVRMAADLLSVSRYAQGQPARTVDTDNREALAAFRDAEALMKKANDDGLDEAIERYKHAVESDPGFASAQAKLAWAYLRSYGIHGEAATLSLARDNCRSAIRLNPNLVDAHVGLAWAMEEGGDHEKAVSEIRTALSIDPSDPHTVLYQARIYEENGQLDLAEATYKRVQQLRPNYWLGYNELGVLLDEQGRFSDALIEFRKASAAAPKNALPLSNIGNVLLETGRLDEALDALNRSMALKPIDLTAVALSTLALIRRHSSDAVNFAQRGVTLNPSSAGNYLALGDALSSEGHTKAKAPAVFRRGVIAEEEELRTQHTNGPGWMLLALLHAKLGESAVADSLVAKARTLHADDISSQLLEIRTFELLGRRDEALAAVQQMMQKTSPVFLLQTAPDLDKLREDPRYQKLVPSMSATT